MTRYFFSSKGGRGGNVFCFDFFLFYETDEQVVMGDMMTCNESCRVADPGIIFLYIFSVY